MIALGGSGIAPTTTFTPTAINHGSVTVGSSGTITGTFANTSPVTITLGNPFATPGAASFAITGGMVAPCTNGMMLPTMTGCTFTSTFTPGGAGMISSTYTFDFTANVTGNPNNLPVWGYKLQINNMTFYGMYGMAATVGPLPISLGTLTWTIDVFEGENAGLEVAEVELEDEGQRIDMPPWVGEEITHDRRFYNAYLALEPFTKWQR